MEGKTELTEALELLGEILTRRNLQFDIAVVGGAALLLQNLVARATMDMDAVAIIEGEKWSSAKPLPVALVVAVREVARVFDLPHQPRDEKDWLNAGPSMLLRLGLPPGFQTRASVHEFGGLTVRIAARQDLIYLKVWSCTDPTRGARRAVDLADLRTLRPSVGELRQAVEWCQLKDGRSDFIRVEAAGVIEQLGFSLEDLIDE